MPERISGFREKIGRENKQWFRKELREYSGKVYYELVDGVDGISFVEVPTAIPLREIPQEFEVKTSWGVCMIHLGPGRIERQIMSCSICW